MPLFEYECEKCGNRFEKLVLHESDMVRGTKFLKILVSAFPGDFVSLCEK